MQWVIFIASLGSILTVGILYYRGRTAGRSLSRDPESRSEVEKFMEERKVFLEELGRVPALTIHSAVYGAGHIGKEDLPVAPERLRMRNALVMPVQSSALVPRDPADRERKRIAVKYSFGNADIVEAEFWEGDVMVLPEPKANQRPERIAPVVKPQLTLEVRGVTIVETVGPPANLSFNIRLKISNQNTAGTTVYGWGLAIYDASPVDPYQPRITHITPSTELLQPITFGYFQEGNIEFLLNARFIDIIRKKFQVVVTDRADSTWMSHPQQINQFMLRPSIHEPRE